MRRRSGLGATGFSSALDASRTALWPAQRNVGGPPRCRRFLRSWAGDASLAAVPAAVPIALEAAPVLVSPPRSASPCCASQRYSPAPCWPAACAAAPHLYCFSAPTSPAGEASGAAAAAARAVDAELRALRSARRAYQRAALGQHELADGLARSVGDALRRAGDGDQDKAPSRPQSAGMVPDAGGRRKWQRNLATELRGVCGRGGVDALAGSL